MDYTVRGILQARILEWVAFCFSRCSSNPEKPRSPALRTDSLPTEQSSVDNYNLKISYYLIIEPFRIVNDFTLMLLKVMIMSVFQSSRIFGWVGRNV